VAAKCVNAHEGLKSRLYPSLRLQCPQDLEGHHVATKPIVPDILSGLTSKDVGFKNASVWALTRIQIDPDLAVRALTNAASDQAIRYLCLKAIGNYGAGATSAVPFLVDALHGPRPPDFHDVLETLKSIDPEAANEARRK